MATGRIQCLDGLRGIAAASVVLFHIDFMYVPQAQINNLVPIHRGYLSVDLFFLLSGFVMAHVYGNAMSDDWRTAWRSFLVARFARLYPLFLVTLLFLVAVVETGYVRSKFVSFSTELLLLQPFMLQAMHYGLNWNYPSWSIGTEVGAYVIFIFSARYLLRGRHSNTVAVSCIVLAAAMCWMKGGELSSGSQIPAYVRTFIGFTLGVLIYREYRAHGASRAMFRLCGVLSFGPFWLLAWYTGYDVFAILAFASVIAICVTDNGVIRDVLDSRPCRTLGDWSYGIYLWHAPIHFAIMAGLAAYGVEVRDLSRTRSLLIASATLVLIVAIAATTYRWVEVPARRSITTHLNRRFDNFLSVPKAGGA